MTRQVDLKLGDVVVRLNHREAACLLLVASCTWMPGDGPCISVLSMSRTIGCVDTATRKAMRGLEGHGLVVTTVDFASDGGQLENRYVLTARGRKAAAILAMGEPADCPPSNGMRPLRLGGYV